MNTLSYLPLVEQLSSRVIRILGCNPGIRTLQGTNTYLVGQGNRRILIDSSGASDYSGAIDSSSNTEEILNKYVDLLGKELAKQNCSLQEILITHWHPDHTGGVQSIFKKLTKHPIQVSKYRLMDQPEFDTVTKYNYVEDQHVFKTEGATIKTVFTPGHSKDHLSFYLEEENALFSGDCILGETTALFEDLTEYMASLEKILNIKPETIYPGHGPVVKDAKAKVKQYIDHRNKRNEQIIEALKNSNEPLDAQEIVKRVYEGLSDNLFPAACVNVMNHLSWLSKQGKVEELDNDKWKLKKIE